MELGSDIGGSIRNPAHYNGVYGLKPSWGIVPVRGHIPGPPGSLVHVDVGVAGPIGRSVADLRTALQVLAGPLPEDAVAWRLQLDGGPPIGGVSELRVATVFGDGTDVVPVAADVRARLESFAGRIEAAGARVDAVPLPVSLAEGFSTWRDLTLPIIGVGLPDATFAGLAQLDNVPGDDAALVIGRAMTSRYRSWMHAVELRQRQRLAWAQFFEQYDVVLAPVMPTAAFPHDTDRPMAERLLDVDGVAVPHFVTLAWCGAIGAMLLPAVALPTGLTQAGLPVGVQVIGSFLSDLRLLRIAEVLDAAAGPGFVPPPLG
jgi:amidase